MSGITHMKQIIYKRSYTNGNDVAVGSSNILIRAIIVFPS